MTMLRCSISLDMSVGAVRVCLSGLVEAETLYALQYPKRRPGSYAICCAGECESMAQDLEDARKDGAEAADERDMLSGQLADLRAEHEELVAAHAALQ
jgi:hypothetical protein